MALADYHHAAPEAPAPVPLTVFGSLTPPAWRELPDTELRRQLDGLGVRPGDAAMMVAKRDTTLGAILIDKVLRPAG